MPQFGKPIVVAEITVSADLTSAEPVNRGGSLPPLTVMPTAITVEYVYNETTASWQTRKIEVHGPASTGDYRALPVSRSDDDKLPRVDWAREFARLNTPTVAP